MGTIAVRASRGATVYQAKVRIKGFSRLSRTFRTQAQAQAWIDQQEASIGQRVTAARAVEDQKRIAAECAPQYRLFGDLMRRYLVDVTPQKRSAVEEAVRLRGLLKHSLAACTLEGLTTARIALWRDERLVKVSGSTVNRDMNLLGHIIEVARREWDVAFEMNPFQRVRRPRHALPRERRLSPTEEVALIKACAGTKNPYVLPIIKLALETAMRRGEIVELEWERVHFQGPSIQLTQTKNGKPRGVALSRRAIATLEALRPTIPTDGGPGYGELKGRVFPHITANALKLAFRRTLDRANILDFHFHDLRHEATSRMVEKGLSVMEVASITGHEDVRMLRRYTHLRMGDLAKKLD